MDTAVLSSNALLEHQRTLYQKILTAQNPEQIARIALDYIDRSFTVDRVSVVLINLQNSSVKPLVVLAQKEIPLSENEQRNLTGMPFSNALQEGQCVLLDESEFEVYAEQSELFAELYQVHGIRSIAFIPLLAQNKLVGSLNLGSKNPLGLTPGELEIAAELATPIAVAIQQAQLKEEASRQEVELRIRENFLASLTRMTLESAAIDDYQEMLHSLAKNLLALFAADDCYITNINEEKNEVIILAGSKRTEDDVQINQTLPAEATTTLHVLLEKRVIAIDDAHHSTFVDKDLATEFNTASLLGIPLISKEKKLGAAILIYNESHRFTPEEINRAEQTTTPLSLVIAKAHLLHQEREQRELAEALRDAGKLLNATLDVDEVVDRILGHIAKVVPFDAATMVLVQNGRVQLTRHRVRLEAVSQSTAHSDQHINIQNSDYIEQVIHSKKPIVYHSQPTTGDNDQTISYSWIGAPIIVQNETTAVVSMTKLEPNFYNSGHIDRLAAYTGQVALALHNAKLFDASQRQLEELSVLQALAAAIANVFDEDQLLEQATQIIGDTLFPHNFGILLLDESTQILNIHSSYRINSQLNDNRGMPLTSGIVGHVASSRRPYRSPDVHNDPHYILTDPDTNSELCVPIFIGNKVIGVINAESTKINAFSNNEEFLLVTFARQLGIAIEKLRLFSETQSQAEELRLISRILRYLNATPEVTAVFPELTANIKRLTHCTAVALYLVDNKKKISQTISIDITQPFPQAKSLHETIAAKDILNGEIYKIPSLPSEAEMPFEQALLENGMQSSIYVPLSAGERPFGFLNLVWDKPNGYKNIPLTRFQQVAVSIALALQRSHLFEEFKQWAHLLAILHELSRQLTGLTEVSALCITCAHHLNQNLSFHSVSVFTADNDSKRVILQAIEGPNKELLNIGEYSQKFGEGLIGLAAQTGKTMVIKDTLNHPNFLPSARLNVRSELILPLRQADQLVGILNVDSEKVNAFTENDIAILRIAADQLTAAIGRAQLFEQTRQHAQKLEQRNRELVALNEVSQLLVATLERHTIYQAMYQKVIAPLMNLPHFTVALYDHTSQIIYCDFAITDGEETDISQFPPFSYGDGLISETIRLRQPQIADLHIAIPNLKAKGRVVHVGDERQPKSGLYLPLISADIVIGVMYVQDYEVNAFDESDIRLLSMLASQASVAIEKSRLFKDTQARAAKLEALSTLSTELRTAKSVEEMLPIVLQRAMKVVKGSLGSLYLLDLETNELVSREVYPPNPDLVGRRFKIGEGITGHIAATGEIHITENMANSKLARFYPEEESMVKDSSIRSGIGLPLQTSDKIIGVLYINLPHQHTFTPDEIEFMTAISEIASSAIDRMQLLQTLEERVAARTKELADANEQLKELDRLKSKFVSEVSHELRTPITNLSLYLDLFSHSKPEKHDHYLSILHKQTDRLTHLIEDILSLSRVEMGKGQLEFTPVNLNELVASVIETKIPRTEKHNLTLAQSLSPDLPAVLGEKNQLSQVVAHLLQNAIEHTQAGTISVSTDYDETKCMVSLTVADTGSGIDEIDLPHIFERFYRGEKVSQSNVPGTGLGLAIVKEVVDLHEGQIKVNGRENQGASFTIWLPINKNEDGEKDDAEETLA